MRKLYIILAAIFCFSCSEELNIHNDNKFSLHSESELFSGNVLSFSGHSSSASILVSSSETSLAWGIKCVLDDSWCTYQKLGKELIVSVKDNNSTSPRSTTFSVVIGEEHKEIEVRQDFIKYLNISQSSLNIGHSRQDINIAVECNLDNSAVNVECESDWLSDISFENNALSFKVSRNYSQDSERSATIRLSYEDMSSEIVVTQAFISGYLYAIPISDLDFDAYPVYEIWDEAHDKQIALLCEEFLYKPEIIKERLLVAYPVVEGEADYSSGLVVSNGGTVTWDGASIASYSAGTQSEIPEVLYILPGDSKIICQVPDLDEDDLELLITAVAREMKVVDTREGAATEYGGNTEVYTYSVQKIANQLWMRENLKTTRYIDGSLIPTGILDNSWGEMCTSIVRPACKICCPKPNRYYDANAPEATASRNQYGVNYNFGALVGASFVVTSTIAFNFPFEDVISPAGWAIPTPEQFTVLHDYLSQGGLTISEYFDFMLLDGSSEYQNISGFSGTGCQWGSAKGGYNDGIYYATLKISYKTLGSDINTTGHIMKVSSLRKDKSFKLTDINIGCAVYLRCIKQ